MSRFRLSDKLRHHVATSLLGKRNLSGMNDANSPRLDIFCALACPLLPRANKVLTPFRLFDACGANSNDMISQRQANKMSPSNSTTTLCITKLV
jgi:hypothetical protein